MNTAYVNSPDFSFFSEAKLHLDHIISELQSSELADNAHGDIEQYINKEGFEVLRCLFQGYLNMQATNEPQHDFVTSSNGSQLTHVKHNTTRKLTCLFGDVIVTRKRYRQHKQVSHFPLDAQLNLSADQYSDGIRHRVAVEAVRGSFDNAIEAISKTTGGHVAKRQSLELVKDVAQDFESYYRQNRHQIAEQAEDLLVLTFDGKGVVMRPDGLRECTKKAAKKSKKLNSRLSPGEKKDRKRMAQVAAVYTVLPHIKTAESIMKVDSDDNNVKEFKSPARNKRVWASVEREAEVIIEEAFQEALQRDPTQQRDWVILVDGLPHQLKLISRVMKRLKIEATVVMDFIHVLEYLWKAAWCFFDKGDDAVESWVAKKAVKILNGYGNQVAKGIRISASKQKILKRENVDKCANYLLKNKDRLRYGEALTLGYPIASGVIEGACRHLINDRLDITGARWSLGGAEAILKLRSLKSSGDFDNYWTFHKQLSKDRRHRWSTNERSIK
jgi:hypothetical protein